MGWTGIDALINDITVNGKFQKMMFNRTIITGATSAAGRWHELLSGGGTGGAMTLTGTAGAGIALNRSTVGALPLNANVATDIRRLLSMAAVTSASTAVPAWLMLTDLIHIYPSCALVTSPTSLSNHPTWTGTGDTRMTNAIGVQGSLIVTTAGTAGNGAITPTYYDQDGNSTASVPIYAVSTTHPIGALYAQSGAAVTIGGPFIPLAAGDTGMQRMASYTIGTGLTSGVGAFVLHRPIATIPIGGASLAGERDFLTGGVPLLPRIYDDACLGLFVLIGGALTAGNSITGEINYGWGA